MIAKQCNNQLENTRAVINQSVTSGRPQIKWTVGIPRVKECKAPGVDLKKLFAYTEWITTLRTVNKTEACVFLSMPNPKDSTKRAFTEDLLGK
ncbi:hypothetical protein KEM48_005061 [Puccinia striiformis f. sp. tritici PST-130]|uniref:Uncharacterized protein n=1 Tax=Puccinia striiformis TaxID=27350 RepID=A0A2S4UTT7_9BASI|nr:hypothetical protein KEM48_005061 [Puccinia striiformis f. sp. tritici PST-130]POW00621.1 hypothetical protein PSTT_13039 [Puccinia striiformis]